MTGSPIGTSQAPLYFLHIPKTAGSSLTRLLEDVFPVGTLSPHQHLGDLRDAGGLGDHGVLCGHHGLYPLVSGTPPAAVVTLLREPAARAWSHYRFMRGDGRLGRLWPGVEPTFRTVLDDPRSAWMAADYQARWLSVAPRPQDGRRFEPRRLTEEDEHIVRPLPFPVEELEVRASATLRDCSLVGTAERLNDFVTALGRLLGRWLPPPSRLNVGATGGDAHPPEAETVRARSPIDLRLHARASALLDQALVELPEPPPEPIARGPYELRMDGPLRGTGWHGRVHAPGVGWHRWTGPGTRSTVRFDVRMPGAVLVTVAIVSARDDHVVRSLRLSVQGRRVDHVFDPREVGVAAVARAELDPERPLTLEIDVDRTDRLRDSVSGAVSPDPAGLAIGTIGLAPVE